MGLKHASLLDWQDVWNSHLVFIGKPNLNPITCSLLEGKGSRADELRVVHNTRPRPGEAEQYRRASSHRVGEKYALTTRVQAAARCARARHRSRASVTVGKLVGVRLAG